MKTINYLFLSVLIINFIGGCSSTPSGSGKAEAADYNTQLGIAYLQKGRLDLAQMNLDKALRQSPSSAATQHYYALLQEKLGNDKKAGEHFRKAIRLDSKNPELSNNYGSFLCRTGQYAEAEKSFLRALKDPLYKTPEFAYTNAGICVQKQGRIAKSESYFRKALQINGRFPAALYEMAKLEYEKGDNAKAQAFLYRYNDAGVPATPETLLLCNRIHKKLNEPGKAEACAADLRSKFPESPAANLLD